MPKFKTSPTSRRRKYDYITTDVLTGMRVEGLTVVEMSERLNIPRGTVAHLLVSRGVAGKVKGRKGPRKNKGARPEKVVITGSPKVYIPPSIEKTMRQIYPTMPRTAVARQLGIPKTLLIHYALQLGLKSGGVRVGLVRADDE